MLTFRSEDFLLKNSILRFKDFKTYEWKVFFLRKKPDENNLTTLTPRGLVSDRRSGPKCKVLI